MVNNSCSKSDNMVFVYKNNLIDSNMFTKRQKLKYHPVENVEETQDFDEKKRTFCNTACFWSSLFTSILIGTYYVPSICLTFYQRWFLQTFHFPLTVVIVHMSVKFILAALIRAVQGRQRIMLEWKEYLAAVAPMGVFSGLDIGLSNWGLELIQISLYTMTKSTTVVFILGFSMLFKLEKKSWSLGFIVGMIATGLVLFTYKATHFDVFGFVLLILASMSSGIRWTCVQLLLQKSKIGIKNPIDMIYHMQPWMVLSLLPFAIVIEGPAVIKNSELFRTTDTTVIFNTIFKILLGALIAFFMEVCEVLVVGYTSSLTLSIAGIVKEVFVLVLAVQWNGDQLSLINVVGLLICLLGITCHVLHKLKSSSKTAGRIYEVQAERRELGENLINEENTYDLSSENEDKSDSQILFDILRSRDR